MNNGKAVLALDQVLTDNVAALEGRIIFRFRPNSFLNRKTADALEATLLGMEIDEDAKINAGNFAFLVTMTEDIEFGDVSGSVAIFRDWWKSSRQSSDVQAAFNGYLAQESRVLTLWAEAHNERLEAIIPSERRPRFMRTKEELAALDDPNSPLAVSAEDGKSASSDGPKPSTNAKS